MREIADRDPVVTTTELDDEIAGLDYSLDHYYSAAPDADAELPPGLDGALRSIFDDFRPAAEQQTDVLPAADLMRRLERQLMSDVYRWTGHFPERTRLLLRQLAKRAGELEQVYPAEKELSVALALTTLVTSLAMTSVFRGSYMP
jgi:hypothetical protein